MTDRPLACAGWQDDLAAWLAADIAPEREAALLAHLAECDACRAEADSLHGVAAALLTAAPDDPGAVPAADEPGEPGPPADLEDRIARRLASERRRFRVPVVAAVLAAAAAAVAAVVVVATSVDRERDLPDGTEVAFAVVPEDASAEAVMVDDDGGTLVHLRAEGLDPDVTYALWMAPPGGTAEDRVPAGTFRPNDAGEVDAELRCAYPVSRYARVWATTPDGEVVLDTA